MKVTALGRELHQQLFDVENKRMVRRFRLRVLHQGLGQDPKQVWIVVWEPSGACCDVLTNCTALQQLATCLHGVRCKAAVPVALFRLPAVGVRRT